MQFLSKRQVHFTCGAGGVRTPIEWASYHWVLSKNGTWSPFGPPLKLFASRVAVDRLLGLRAGTPHVSTRALTDPSCPLEKSSTEALQGMLLSNG